MYAFNSKLICVRLKRAEVLKKKLHFEVLESAKKSSKDMVFTLEKPFFKRSAFFENVVYILQYKSEEEQNVIINLWPLNFPSEDTLFHSLSFFFEEKEKKHAKQIANFLSNYFLKYLNEDTTFESFFIKNLKGKSGFTMSARIFNQTLRKALNILGLEELLKTKVWKIFLSFWKYAINKRWRKISNLLGEEIYSLVEYSHVEGRIKFPEVDRFAQKIFGLDEHSQARLKAIIISTFFDLESTRNDTWHEFTNIQKSLIWKLNNDTTEAYKLLRSLYREGIILKRTHKGKNYLLWNNTHEKEQEIFNILKSMFIKKSAPWKASSLNNKIKIQNHPLLLTDLQKEAITRAKENTISIISGGPGTGKSVLIKSLFNDLLNKYEKEDIVVLAPTGMAVNKLRSYDIENVGTFHQTFPDFFYKTKSKQKDKLEIKVLIIDEFSMVNLNMLYNVLSNLYRVEKLVLIGDIDQLPSIGSGNLFSDIKSLFEKRFENNFTYLNKNFRFQKVSNIKKTINYFQSGFLNGEADNLIQTDKENFFEDLYHLYFDILKDYSLLEKDIISPFVKNFYGTQNINEKIQAKIHGFTEEKFLLHDKIMKIKNDYERELFNGQIGLLISIAKSKKNARIFLSDGREKEILNPNKYSNNFALAYASTVHKFQGSQSKVIILVFVKAHTFMHSENLIYTALTRAQERIYIIGDIDFFALKAGHFVKQVFQTSLPEFKEQL